MKYDQGGKRKPMNLFFIEIIIALLFFSISGAVIMKVFAAADAKTRKSELLEEVVITAQSIAEIFSTDGDAYSAVREGTGISQFEELSAVPLYDGKVILSVSEQSEAYGAGEIRRLSMVFLLDEGEIYSLDCSAYVPGGDRFE